MTLILVHTAHPQAVSHAGPGFGRLLSPRQFSRAYDTAEAGIPWAADNDCFQGLDADAFKRMLNSIYGLPGCLFVASPDVVGDAVRTLELWDEWRDEMVACWQPLALVAQDGLTSEMTPWAELDALFIGGSTEFKLSVEAERLAREARVRGKWVHVGRVNSYKRFQYCRTFADSIDGSKFSRWRNTWLPDALEWHKDHLQERMAL